MKYNQGEALAMLFFSIIFFSITSNDVFPFVMIIMKGIFYIFGGLTGMAFLYCMYYIIKRRK